MRITEIVWLEDIVIKLEQKHSVQQYEVEEVFCQNAWFRFVERGHRPDENVYAAFGRTLAGRYLIVFFVYKEGGRALVISARDMTDTERKAYERK